MRIAAIDIGTNSVRCTIVEVLVGGPRKTIDDEKAYTRLGRGLYESGRLSEQSIDDTLDALDRMLQIAEQHDVTHIRAVATAAVRRADNAGDFIERVRERLAIDIEIIDEDEEARLAFLSAADGLGVEGRSAVVDIGGGSVEVIRATDRQVEFMTSLPLGAVVLSERYHTEDPIPKGDYERLVKYVRRTLKEALAPDPDPVSRLIGSGGTVTTIGTLIAAQRSPSLTSVHAFEFRRAELIHLLAYLRHSTADQRQRMKAMPEGRVDIILAGAVVLDECMRALGVNEIVVNAHGMREGVIVDTIERERGAAEPFSRTQAVTDFARRCHTDLNHAEQVSRLSLSLFDELAVRLGLDTKERPLLETAAVLHDVGYHIAYERHHRHSYHLITYSELPGFTSHELRLIAAIARYHRGALPKTRHEAMADLKRTDRQRVERLAAFLRLADGLDRSRGQRVRGLRSQLRRSRLVLTLEGDGPFDVEIHGAQRKSDLFERAFGVRVDITPGGAPSQGIAVAVEPVTDISPSPGLR